MERKKVLVFETSRTMMRAFELVLRGTAWVIVKATKEDAIFPAIESSSPDVLLMDRRALSPEMREALHALPIPVIFCAAQRDETAGEPLFLPRPFSSDELFESLGTALAWEMSQTVEDAPANGVDISDEFDADEEPVILAEPDDPEYVTDMPAEEPPPVVEAPPVLPSPSPVPSVPSVPFVPDPSPSLAEKVEERVLAEVLPADIDIPEGSPMPEMIRAIIRRELREVMKEYFWEEAPALMRQVVEEEIKKVAAKQ